MKEHAANHVTNMMLANAKYIYPENTPTTKEAYYYRMIFERFFPQNAARLTVPGGPSVACSTAKVLEWDAAWSRNPDPSGRAVLGVHVDAMIYERCCFCVGSVDYDFKAAIFIATIVGE